MRRATRTSLRARAPWRATEGFGGATRAATRYLQPETADALMQHIASAAREGLPITLRGAGRSYGDAAIGTDGLVLDLCRLNRILAWDPATGVIEAEPGVTIEDLWRHTIGDGYWPEVVPGTMRPTLGGCLAMNIHGKNNYRAGTIGEHVIDFDLVTPQGDRLRCSRDENADVFFGAIGGLGLLGVMTRVRLRLKKVESGYLRVEPIVDPGLAHMLSSFDASTLTSDYCVGWVDCLAQGRGLGRGVIHRATYVPAAGVADVAASFEANRQGLPASILGLPKKHIWRLMRPFMFNGGVQLVNTARYHLSRLGDHKTYLQTHVAFAFLLDYVPDWRLAYGPAGLIQYQVFVPHATADATLTAILERCHHARRPPFLGVLKRHRSDDFLLSHAIDGWSLAMDFPVGHDRADLWRLTEALTEIVLQAGGRFYFAKDAVLRPQDVTRAYGAERLARFAALKSRLDPGDVLTSDLWRRVASPPAR